MDERGPWRGQGELGRISQSPQSRRGPGGRGPMRQSIASENDRVGQNSMDTALHRL